MRKYFLWPKVMYMFVPFYIFVNIVFVLMGRMAYWILK